MTLNNPSQVTRRVSERCSGVGSDWIACSDAPMAPSRVVMPVAVTRTAASPDTTRVPAKTEQESSAAAVSVGRADFPTDTDSPDSSDSSTVRRPSEAITPSAAMRSPAVISMRSPGTRSREAIWHSRPSRMTRASGSASACNACKARSLRASCRMTMPSDTIAPAEMKSPSPRLPSARYSPAATSSRTKVGSRSVSATMRANVRCCLVWMMLAPVRASTSSASACVKPR